MLNIVEKSFIQINGQFYTGESSDLVPTGTTQTINWDDGNVAQIDLTSATGNVTLTLSNPRGNAIYRVIVVQGATARDLIWPSNVLWPGGTAPVISLGANDIDTIELLYDATEDQYYSTFDQDFS